MTNDSIGDVQESSTSSMYSSSKQRGTTCEPALATQQEKTAGFGVVGDWASWRGMEQLDETSEPGMTWQYHISAPNIDCEPKPMPM